MAKDGTRRGGNRAGSGRKSAKMPLPIMGFDADSEAKTSGNGADSDEKKAKKSVSDGVSVTKTGVRSSAGSSKSKRNSGKTTVKTRKTDVSGGKVGRKLTGLAYDDDVSDLEGVNVPPVDEYLRQEQKCGKPLKADHILEQTVKWLREIKCENIVSRQLIEEYAMSVARWIQTEELISQFGFLAKHPTTGAAIASPYVKMSQDYMKQVNQTWYQIYQIVKDNAGDSIANNSDDPMERLLQMRGG